jgi:hypothetical protein
MSTHTLAPRLAEVIEQLAAHESIPPGHHDPPRGR